MGWVASVAVVVRVVVKGESWMQAGATVRTGSRRGESKECQVLSRQLRQRAPVRKRCDRRGTSVREEEGDALRQRRWCSSQSLNGRRPCGRCYEQAVCERCGMLRSVLMVGCRRQQRGDNASIAFCLWRFV